jgi:replicative DNA helicase
MRTNGKPWEVSWGLRDVDEAVGTGVGGRLVVVGARPSNGKTTWLFSWLNSLLPTLHDPPLKVLCFWTERAAALSYLTWGAMRAGLSLDATVKGQLSPDVSAELQADVRRLEYLDDLESRSWVRFADLERPTVADMVAAVETRRPDILIFDYLQRIKPESRQSKFDAIGEAATVLQQLAVRHKALVVVGSQLKRRGDGAFDKYRPPHLEDFKLSGEIEENADLAIGLFRPLRRMTMREEADVRTGAVDLSAWTMPDTMAVKVLKHRYWGDAADRMVKVCCKDGRVTDLAQSWRTPPIHEVGDAWEVA